MSPRPLTRQESQARTRTRLVHSAEKVFLKRGYLAASIGQIARAAGYTTGAVYSNFASKEELGLAVMEQRLIGSVTALQDELSAAEPTVAARLLALETWSRRALGNEPWIVLTTEFILAARHNPPVRSRFSKGLVAARKMIAAILAQQDKELGITLPMDPDRLAAAVLGLGMGLSVQRVADPSLDEGILAESIGLLIGRQARSTAVSN